MEITIISTKAIVFLPVKGLVAQLNVKTKINNKYFNRNFMTFNFSRLSFAIDKFKITNLLGNKMKLGKILIYNHRVCSIDL